MVKNRSERELAAKMDYESPKMQIVKLQTADIIVTSMGGESGGKEDGWTGYY